ncbi:MAG TPA: riboflavin synthase [Gemmatimonadota bacterium]|nr:riboflavin synthase [Gemmatimonadota bacterium]
MFTGIIESVGEVRAVDPFGDGRRLTIAAPWSAEAALGESIAVDGACLTVVDAGPEAFRVEAVRETVARTIVGEYAPGRRVNLERALRAGDRLGGHFVQGHVDGCATVQAIERQGENRYIEIALPASGRPLVAPQGSIAVNGVSLTVLGVTDAGVRLSIIPHTWSFTMLADLAPGNRVNVEYDLIARILSRLLEERGERP